jgi:Tol biopolymer transport system component
VKTARVILLVGCAFSPAVGQQASDTASKLLLKPERTITFNTTEGTWTSLDVSPDGQTIIFDMLGDLYTMPITGGKARAITQGMPWDEAPRFSPDGKRIAFISDRSGSDNLWVMNVDGSGLRAITKETYSALGSPVWHPDGKYIVARYLPGTSTGGSRWASFNRMEQRMYHVDGGNGMGLVTGAITTSGAFFAPDGKKLYYSVHAGAFGYDLQVGRFQVASYDMATGQTTSLTNRRGGGLRPIISPDGRYLVFATREHKETGLRIRDLRDDREEWLALPVQRDGQTGYTLNDVFPGYAFTPDSRTVIVTANGKITRVDVATKKATVIPMSVHVEAKLAAFTGTTYKLDDGPFNAKQLRSVNASPDGRSIVFSAVGKAWVMDVADRKPRRLTNGTGAEYDPSFSPDGKWIAYVSWSDEGIGHVWKIPAAGGAPSRITSASGYYVQPRWSPDGTRLVYLGGSGREGRPGESGMTSLFWIASECPSEGCTETHKIANGVSQGTAVTVSRDGTRVYYVGGGTLQSARFDGTDVRSHLKMGGFGGALVPSPDERWVVVQNRYDLYLVPLVAAGDKIPSVEPSGGELPVQRVTNTGGIAPMWSPDGKTLMWTWTNHFFRASLDEILAKKELGSWKPEDIEISLSVPRDIPQGAVVLRGARIITMKGDEVIAKGDILIENGRIKAIGRSVAVPRGAKAIDVSGKTIVPGLVDVHSHPGGAAPIAEQSWPHAAQLAFGVTTQLEVSGSPQEFANAERIEAGSMIGPRSFAVAQAIGEADGPFTTQEEADQIVRRYKAMGAASLKDYALPLRTQRQRIVQAARTAGINATNEGYGDFKLDMSYVFDGYTGWEHALYVVPVYNDVAQFVGKARTTYTPTLIVGYLSGMTYMSRHFDPHNNEKLRRFMPPDDIEEIIRHGEVHHDEDFDQPLTARGARDIVRAGGSVGLGSHGNVKGLGAQWELWLLQSGGMTPLEALRCATLFGARAIGYGDDLGSLEVGKVADLLVLDKNPLDDIANISTIRYVMKGGTLYEGGTLNRVWPTPVKFLGFWWTADEQAKPKQ